MSINHKTAITALALTLLSSVSFAAEMPKPCGPDPRERCIAYKPGQIVIMVLAPGQTATIQLPDGEVVYSIGASDNNIIKGEGSVERVATGSNTTGDPNLETTIPGDENNPSGFIMLKAKKELAPQSYAVIGEWTHPITGKKILRNHTFELHTTPVSGQGAVTVGMAGDPAAEQGHFYSLTFSDPVAKREIRRAEARKFQEEMEVSMVADRLQQVQTSTLRRNVSYDGQGTESDRLFLAPSAPAGLDAMWDDGQRTLLRYPGNRGTPVAYEVLANGTEAVIGQNVVVDPDTKGSMLILHKVVQMLRLRDGDSVLCITNTAYDPVGSNPGTGTADPGVFRDVKGP